MTPNTEQVPAGSRIGRAVVWAFVAAILLLLTAGLLIAFQAPPEGGRAAPDFTLTLYGGEEFTLSQLRGQVVVINFWASWCIPCIDEAPALEAAWQEYRDKGVMFVGVDYVDAEDKALEFIDRYGITYPNGPDLRTRISGAYRVRAVPETFIVDRNGKVNFYAPRPITYDELVAEIDKALAIPAEGE